MSDMTPERVEQLRAQAAELRDNAHKAGKEGAGTHRNSGDSGRVGELWAEVMREIETLIAQEESKL